MAAPVPNVDVPDRIWRGFSRRQALVALPFAVADFLLMWALQAHWQIMLFALVIPTAAGLVAVLALQDEGGGVAKVSPIRWGAAWFRTPRHLAVAVPRGPRKLVKASRRHVGAMRLWLRGIDGEGRLSLERGRVARILRASAFDLRLRSDEERRAAVGGFGEFLDALEGPVQFLVRAEPIRLEEQARRMERQIWPQDLGALARDHASLLRSLSGRLRRRPYVVVVGDDAEDVDGRARSAAAMLEPIRIAAKALGERETIRALEQASGDR